MASPPNEPSRGKQVRVIVHSFFIVPGLIAVFYVLIQALIGMAVGSPPSSKEALNTIARGSERERWQAARVLAGMLQSGRGLTVDQEFLDQMIFEYRRAGSERTPFLRFYLTLAMGLTRDPRFEPALLEGLQDDDRANQLAAIHALGLAGGDAAVAALTPLLDDPDPTTVHRSVIALGWLGQNQVVPALQPLLGHPEPNVRWEAAIALAQLGDRSGVETINTLLDRNYYGQFPGVEPSEQDWAIQMAVEVASRLKDPRFKENLVRLSRNDPNLRVVNAALIALKQY
ncbi:MAG: HEAT repeat domain-containing protein [Candidatus Marinimicrobia bacterium]|nr:HEAT repeat domain-containing protein [Candidatus Neomarinimicrobiota bacterium]